MDTYVLGKIVIGIKTWVSLFELLLKQEKLVFKYFYLTLMRPEIDLNEQTGLHTADYEKHAIS